MLIPAAVLGAGGLVAGLLPGIGPIAQAAAVRLEDQAAYNATVLSGAYVTHSAALFPPEPTGITAADHDRRTGQGSLGPGQWWLSTLARKIGMPTATLFGWLNRGWITGRQDTRPPYRWIITADHAEVETPSRAAPAASRLPQPAPLGR